MEALFLFCCEPCLRGDADSKEFYDILGVTSAESSDGIRTAYRRRALELHPDKLKQKGVQVTAAHNEEFNRLKDAYDVLSDPRKRRIYDRVGETGLNILEGKAGTDPLTFLKNLKKNKRAMARIALMITIAFGLVVLQPVLFILKVNEDVNGPWFAIWTPMLLFDGILLINTLALLAMDSEVPEGENPNTWEDPYPLTTKLWFAWSNVVFIAVQIFILLNLDHYVHWSWAVAFIPWMVYEVNQLVEFFPTAIARVHKQDVSSEVDAESGDAEEAFMRQATAEAKFTHDILEKYDAQSAVVTSLLRVLLLILLIVKLDSESDMTWAVVFVPIWLYFGYQLLFSCYLCRTAGSDLPDVEVDLETIDPNLMILLERAKTIQAKGSSVCCTMLFPLITAILAVVYLDDTDVYNVAIIFVPFFVVVGLLYLVTLCAFYTMVNYSDQIDPATGQAYSPPHEPRPSDDPSTPFNPSGGENNVIIQESGPIISPAPPSQNGDDQDEYVEPQQQQHRPEPVKETHIDLEID